MLCCAVLGRFDLGRKPKWSVLYARREWTWMLLFFFVGGVIGVVVVVIVVVLVFCCSASFVLFLQLVSTPSSVARVVVWSVALVVALGLIVSTKCTHPPAHLHSRMQLRGNRRQPARVVERN